MPRRCQGCGNSRCSSGRYAGLWYGRCSRQRAVESMEDFVERFAGKVMVDGKVGPSLTPFPLLDSVLHEREEEFRLRPCSAVA